MSTHTEHIPQAEAAREPPFGYLHPAIINQHEIGKLTISLVKGAVGFDNLKVPDHAICLLKTDVTSVEHWEGARLPRTNWDAGTVRFLPRDTDLTSRSAKPYNEAMFFFGDHWFREGVVGDVDSSRLDMRFTGLPGGPLTDIVRALICMVKMGSGHSPMLIESLSIALAAAIVVALKANKGVPVNVSNGMNRARIRRVIDYIEENMSRGITLAELSEVAALSQFHFCRSFRTTMGVTPLKYLTERRMVKAKRMLRESRHSLAHVAIDCGFASQSHFTTAFKSATGSPPGRFRFLT